MAPEKPLPNLRSLAAKIRHASMTPEQKAAWRAAVGKGSSRGLRRWHVEKSDAEREVTRQAQSDAALCRVWQFRPPENHRRPERMRKMSQTPEALARKTRNKIQLASVRRILKDLIGVHPELIRDAVIAGLLADPPRSFPYLALAAAYLDGKPLPANPPDDNREDLSELSIAQLRTRALAIAARLHAEGGDGTIIDVQPVEARDE